MPYCSIPGFSSCAKLDEVPKFTVPSAQPKATVPPPPVDALVEGKSYAGWDLNIILLLAMEVQPKIISEREREIEREATRKISSLMFWIVKQDIS